MSEGKRFHYKGASISSEIALNDPQRVGRELGLSQFEIGIMYNKAIEVDIKHRKQLSAKEKKAASAARQKALETWKENG